MIRVALLVVMALLATTVIVELYFATAAGPAVTDLEPRDSDAPVSLEKQPFVPPDQGEFAEILERPLFFPDRTLPPEPTVAAVAAAPMLPLRLTLEGIAISADDRVAVLRDPANNQLLQLTEGMSHDGWLLESVGKNGVIFKRDAATTELALDPGEQRGRR